MSTRNRGLLHHLDLSNLDDLEELSSDDHDLDSAFGQSNKSSIHKHPEFKGNGNASASAKGKHHGDYRRDKRRAGLDRKHSLP